MGWFSNDCLQIEILKARVDVLTEELKETNCKYMRLTSLYDSQIEYADRMQKEMIILRTRLQVYDQIMKGLCINISLDGKKK